MALAVASLFTVHVSRTAYHVFAVEVQPVISAELLAGQYWYNGADASAGGWASLDAAPYLKFNERWSLAPLYQGRYRGTKQVSDFTGGGTPFQDSQNHSFSLKGIRALGPRWKIKAIGAYALEWLRETKDEDWTKGLYDNRRASGGAEAEYAWTEHHRVRLAYDYYAIRFPNYRSLESSQVGAGLGRELAEPDVLNNRNHRLSLGSQMLLPGQALIDLQIGQGWRAYSQQHVVEGSGNLTAETRSDQLFDLTAEGTLPVAALGRARLYTTLGYGWLRLASNQNSYDASKTTFRPNFYAYDTHSLLNRWTLVGPEENPWTASLYGQIARQGYDDRLIQDALGNYGAEPTHVQTATLGLAGGYPIARNFELKAQALFGWSDSNNTYTQIYEYHYNTQSYLIGFRYAY